MKATTTTLALLMAACGGGGGSKPTDGPRAIDGGECGATAACVAKVPGGWTGYVELYDGAAGAEPSCNNPFLTATMVGSAGLMAQPASCSACECGPVSMNHCTASGGSAMLPLVSWATIGFSCDAPTSTTTCTGGLCVPLPAMGFTPGICVHHDGDIMCPEGFDDRHVFYDGVDDTRGCTSCTCGSASGSACPPSGGTSTGSATPSNAVTYCCVP